VVVHPVGLCGLGNMGAAVASRLGAAMPVLAYDPDPQRAAEAARLDGVAAVAGLQELADVGTVVLCLPSPEISVEVATELAATLHSGALLVETSTVTPDDVHRLQDICTKAGIGVVDAAILSGVAQMAAGRATLLTGGAADALEQAAPVLQTLGARRWHFGAAGAGMAAKVVNNGVAHAVMVLLVEAVAMSRAAGVDPRQIAQLLADPDAGLSRPLTHRLLERVFEAEYSGGMPMQAARKDSHLAMKMAYDEGVPLFVINGAHTVYDIAVAQGLGREDYAALAKLWEAWCGRSLEAPERAEPPDERRDGGE
jgi:3-hydroxyisobutyrate dehydrogenase-like beta-hydroxyacid dehydrogenase